MNPFAMGKIMNAKKNFEENHPKFVLFLSHVFGSSIPEGTVIEITVTKPREQPLTSNLRVLDSDLELFENLKNIK